MFIFDRPIATGCVLLLAITFSMNFVIPDCTGELALVTVNTMIAASQIWNIVTCQFYEKSVFKLAFDIVGILIVTKSTKINGGNDQFGNKL